MSMLTDLRCYVDTLLGECDGDDYHLREIDRFINIECMDKMNEVTISLGLGMFLYYLADKGGGDSHYLDEILGYLHPPKGKGGQDD